RAARPTSFLSCHRTSMWPPPVGGLFGFKFSSRPHPWKFGVKRFLALREGLARKWGCLFWATPLEKVIGGVTAIVSYRPGGWNAAVYRAEVCYPFGRERASTFFRMRASPTTAVPASTPTAAGQLPPSHQCRPGTRRRWHIPWQGFVLPHSMTSSNRADNRQRVPWCGRLRSRARDWFVSSSRSPARAPHIRYRVASCCREYSVAASLARSSRAASWWGAAHTAGHRERWRRPPSRSARLRP